MTARARRGAALVALALVAVAVSPPVEAAVGRSVAAHMGQHLVLLLAPVLLVLDRPVARVAALLPGGTRWSTAAVQRWSGPERVAAVVVAAAAAHAVVVSVWHLPSLYDAAVDTPVLHVVEHLSLLAVGWATWAAVRAAVGARPGAAVAALFLVAAQGAALGAVLTFAGRPLYDVPVADPLADQQLAGLLMWVPGGAPYAAAAAWAVVRAVAPRRRPAALAVVRRS